MTEPADPYLVELIEWLRRNVAAEWTDHGVDVIARGLTVDHDGGTTLAEIRDAVRTIAVDNRQSQLPPTLAEIRSAIRAGREPQPEPKDPDASARFDEARAVIWRQLSKPTHDAARQQTRHHPPQPDTPE